MKELDLLKKHWNDNSNFPKISREEIGKMIHKKSSSIVKWIFVISIIEFLLLNAITFILPKNEFNNVLVFKYLDYISIAFSLVFIFLFYRNYRLISTSSSTKELMKRILNTRKTVNIYIVLNIFLVFLLILFALYILENNNNFLEKLDQNKHIIFIMLFITMICFTIGAIWLFYRLIYGILLRKLKNNYNELRKIDF